MDANALEREIAAMSTAGGGVAAVVSRTEARMDAVIASTSGGVHEPSGAGAGAECAAEAGDGDGGRNEVLEAGSDRFFCAHTLPVVTYLLCGCGGKNLPESFPAARCGRFFQKVLRFCVKLMDHVEELVEVSVQLLGGELRPPTYLVEREIGSSSVPPPRAFDSQTSTLRIISFAAMVFRSAFWWLDHSSGTGPTILWTSKRQRSLSSGAM